MTGEAGIGKTSVVRAFTAGLPARTRVLAGTCDDLLTPRSLGPLRDAAAGTPLAEALDGELVFDAALAELRTPTVLVVEDLHWADDATLDVLGYLARRVAELPALLLLTFRDDDDHAWELYNAHRFTEAVEAGERAVALYGGDPVALGQAQVRLSRHYYMAGDTDAAETTARQADQVLTSTGDTAAQAYAATYHGAVLALTGDPAALSTVDRALRLARRADRVDLVELGLNYRGSAHPDLDANGRIALLRESLALALCHGHHEHAARAYTNLGELLYRHTRFDELARCVADAAYYA